MYPDKICNSHIDVAIGLYEKILFFDLKTYEDVILAFIKQKNIRTTDDVDRILELSLMIRTDENKNFYTISDNGVISFAKEKKGNIELPKHKLVINEKIPIGLRSSGGIYLIKALEIFREIESTFREIENKQNVYETDGDSLGLYLISKIESSPYSTHYKLEDLWFFINYCYNECEENVQKKFLRKINNQLWYHFSKSFLNAEYLIFNDYSERLDRVENLFASTNQQSSENQQDETFPALYLYPIKSFIKLAWYAQEACALIKKYIEEPDYRLVLVSPDRETRFSDLCNPDCQFEGKEESLKHEHFVESIIDMTIIDHCYQSNKDNIEKLLRLRARKKLLLNQSDDNMSVMLEMSEIKAISLLYTILIQSEKEKLETYTGITNYFIVDGKRTREKELIYKLENFYIKESIFLKNYFLKEKEDNKNRDFSKKNTLFNFPTYSESRRGVEKYNNSVRKGIENYCHLSHFFYENKKNEKISYETIKKFSEDDCEKTPSFYLQIIEKLHEITHKLIEENKEVERLDGTEIREIKVHIDLLKKLLDSLRSYMKKYDQNGGIPHQYKPYFSYSFYIYKDKNVDYANEISDDQIDNYDYSEFNDRFFLASLGCTPINIGYLWLFYEKYNKKHRALLISCNCLDIRLDEQKDKSDDALRERYERELQLLRMKNLQMQQLYEKKDEQMQQLNEESKKEVRDELDKQRHQTVTLLGILAAFLAFVTASIGTIKIVEGIAEYAIFCLTFMVSLSIFVALIRHPFPDKFSQKGHKANKFFGKHKKNSNIIKTVFIITILLSLLAIFFFFAHSETIKNKTDGELLPTQNTSANGDTLTVFFQDETAV